MDEAEIEFKFIDIAGDDASIYVWKMGGGTIGKKYDGDWKVVVDGAYGVTPVWDFSSGIPKSHFDVAMAVYAYYLEDNEI